MDVVGVKEVGSDWILRDFDPDSIEIRNALDDPEVAAARQRVLTELEGTTDPTLRTILNRLRRNSANIHWSPSKNKILIIDML